MNIRNSSLAFRRRIRQVPCAIVLMTTLFAAASLRAEEPGYEWWPEDLPDFSWAGYDAGESEFQLPERVFKIEDFEGFPDDEEDDTDALRKTISAAEEGDAGGVVLLSEGRYILKEDVRVRKDRVVILGAGSGKTVFDCPKSLSDMHGYEAGWSWSGGMIQFNPGGSSEKIAEARLLTQAGDDRLVVSPLEDVHTPINPGWYMLQWYNDKGADTLLDHLYGGVVPQANMGQELRDSEGARVREWIYVTSSRALEDEYQGLIELTIRQPLRIDVRPEWKCEIIARKPMMNSGIRGVGFEFPLTEYPGHLKEVGYNAIAMSSAVNCVIIDVRTLNADSGIFVSSCRCLTIDEVTIAGRYMHHCICVSWSSDCLVTNWRIEAQHRHGTTISWTAHGNVFSRGFGHQLAMDSHRAASFMNLHTDIEIDHGATMQYPFRSGGSAPRGPHSAKQNVYWNIRNTFRGRPDETTRIGPVREWPRGVFVGWTGTRPLEMPPIANLRQQVVLLNEVPEVPDLYLYQRKLRIGR
ncbi:MAG: hypothetical protein NUW37_00375 [Planctomycetes bacterium]|nr:hypothetical protein [Planctomycetota bacterium]